MTQEHIGTEPELGTQDLVAPQSSSGPWIVEIGAGAEQAGRLETGKTLTIGTRPPSEIVVVDPTVSGRHVKVMALRGGVLVEDLDSKNGVFVGGARVRRAMLDSGRGSFMIGRTLITLRDVSEVQPLRHKPIPGLIGNSACMQRLHAEIRRVAQLDAPVLVLGESGTGKDVIARAIHALSARSGGYLALNAGALGETLADSELFGHRRGAFTGAVQNRPGAFELANRGTLFLDEIAELAPSIQVKLLRAVEDGEVRPLGGTSAVKVKTRIVTATWAPLEQRIERGEFRADLFHRISTFVIEVPPLRQRKSDIGALATSLLLRKQDELGERTLTPDALARLAVYNFPGNVRELFSIVYRAAASVQGREIGPEDIENALPRSYPTRGEDAALDARRVLEAHRGNVSAAARSARVARSTFRSWLKRQARDTATSAATV
ncbi:MAG: sigma 54-interacting transcriptional regulator [Polyangiaceae bacterium]